MLTDKLCAVVTLDDEGCTVTTGVSVVALPLSATVCGLPAALSATRRLACICPALSGANETVKLQLVFAGRTTPVQPSWDIEKLPAFCPDMLVEIPVISSVPLLDKLRVCMLVAKTDVLPKLRVVGSRTADAVAPVPVRLTDCTEAGLP